MRRDVMDNWWHRIIREGIQNPHPHTRKQARVVWVKTRTSGPFRCKVRLVWTPEKSWWHPPYPGLKSQTKYFRTEERAVKWLIRRRIRNAAAAAADTRGWQTTHSAADVEARLQSTKEGELT